jgi:hypothetical protein
MIRFILKTPLAFPFAPPGTLEENCGAERTFRSFFAQKERAARSAAPLGVSRWRYWWLAPAPPPVMPPLLSPAAGFAGLGAEADEPEPFVQSLDEALPVLVAAPGEAVLAPWLAQLPIEPLSLALPLALGEL